MYLAIGAGASVCYAAFLCIGVCPPAVQYVRSRNAKQLVISVEHRISVRFYMASSNERVYKLYNDSCTGIQIYIHTHIYNMMYIYIYMWLIMCIYTWGPGVRDESELGRELGMKTQRAQRSCAAFSSTWTSGSEAGACMGMLVRWTSRPMYWSGVCWRGQGWGNSGKPTLWPVIGEDYLRHRSGPLEAREEVTQCKTECKDER